MNINHNQFEVLSMVEREGGRKITQREMAETVNLSLGMVNRILNDLQIFGLLSVNSRKEVQITKAGMETLEPYRVKRVIILAAGFGERMIPLTFNTPKPLIRVHGRPMVESVLDQAEKAGIKEIILVRGYLWELFDGLLHKYPEIRFIENPIFNEAKNIASAYMVRALLRNAYVCEADLILQKPNLIRKYEYESNYLAKYVDYTDDWCFQVKSGMIREVSVGGTNCYHMYGISYWSAKDGAKLEEDIEKVYHMPGGKERYFEDVPLNTCKKNYTVGIRLCSEGDIEEIDTFNELKKFDPSYNVF